MEDGENLVHGDFLTLCDSVRRALFDARQTLASKEGRIAELESSISRLHQVKTHRVTHKSYVQVHLSFSIIIHLRSLEPHLVLTQHYNV